MTHNSLSGVKRKPRAGVPGAETDDVEVLCTETPPANARSQILDATARLLREKGYEATTVRAIAQAVGIKAGSIYHHFPSKDVIVQEVVNEGVRVVHEAVEEALATLPPDADPAERLEAAIRGHLLASLRYSAYTSASIRAFTFLPDSVREGCRLARRDYEGIWRDIVAAAAGAGLLPKGASEDAVRLLLLGAVNWAGEWYRPDGKLSIDVIASNFSASVFRAINGAPETMTRRASLAPKRRSSRGN